MPPYTSDHRFFLLRIRTECAQQVTSQWRTRTFDTWPCFWRSKKLVGLLLVAIHLHWVVVRWICRERERLVLKWNSQSGSECHTSLFQVCNDISSRLEPLQIYITSKKKRREEFQVARFERHWKYLKWSHWNGHTTKLRVSVHDCNSRNHQTFLKKPEGKVGQMATLRKGWVPKHAKQVVATSSQFEGKGIPGKDVDISSCF